MSFYKNVVLMKAEVEFFDVSFFEANIPLCSLGAVIKDHVNSISMPVDMRIDLKPFEKFENHLKKLINQDMRCDLVAISTMTASFPNALKLAKIAKKYGATVVVGGYHPSALYEEMFEYPDIDAVIRGEGEMTFKEFVLEGPSKSVKGLSYRDINGKIQNNPKRENIVDLDDLPFPDRSIRPNNPIFNKHEVIVTSRGCNGACTFCANDMVHGRWRGRSPKNVVSELKKLYNKNPDLMIHIWDANFMQDGPRVAEIIRLIKENNINFKYFSEMRVDHIIKDPELIKGLAEIGMEWIAIGIESPNQERLKKLMKGITLKTITSAIKILQDNNIKIVGYLMIGDPDETQEQMREYPQFATKMGIDKIMLAIQTPHPGTTFYKSLQEENGITSYDWEKYDIGHSVAKLKHMTNDECEVLMEWCWGNFYNPEWAFSQRKTIKEALYLSLSFIWVGYPGYFIHARPRESVEENLKAYISGMIGHYDLSKYKFSDDEYLDVFKNWDFQFTFHFSDGEDISVITSVDSNAKLSVEVFEGKRKGAMVSFTLNSVDYIEILRALPTQIISLTYWAGFNFENIKSNIKVFRAFTSAFVKALRIDTVNYRKVLKFITVGLRYLPKKFGELIKEEFILQNNFSLLTSGNVFDGISTSIKNLTYKLLMLPFTVLVPVE